MAFGAAFHYFISSGLLNGALSGLGPILLPGVVHLAFFLFLMAGSGYALLSGDAKHRRFIVFVLLSTQLTTSLLLALSRSHHGLARAGSYRYVYMTLFLQLPLLAIVLSTLAERLQRRSVSLLFLAIVVSLYCLATAEAIKARKLVAVWEQERATCLREIISRASDACVPNLYYRNDPQFIRDVWRSRFALP